MARPRRPLPAQRQHPHIRRPYLTDPSGDEAEMLDKPLSEEQRKEVFLALVDAQDHDMGVAQSRQHVAVRFGLSEQQVRNIEREGLDKGWPPL